MNTHPDRDRAMKLMLTGLLLWSAIAARADDFASLKPLMEAAVAGNACPGVVVVVVRNDAIVFREAVGRVTPGGDPLDADAVFDLASLTKPLATAMAVHKLAEQGKLTLTYPVAKHWPEFAQGGKEAVTIEQCLLHTSGLIADNPMADYAGTPEQSLANVAKLTLRQPPGAKFTYSDVGYVALGVVVERASGRSVAEFAKEELYAPLRLKATTFTPAGDLAGRAVPTGVRGGKPIQGAVHDPRAFALGGVAGHAGLFSTADDLARLARMLLNQGTLDGTRLLSAESVRRLTEPVAVPGANQFRSRGFDVATGFSAPRGDRWPPGRGFGHTGFTGTSIWIDPPTRTAVIVLTARTQLEKGQSVTPLRRQVATEVARVVAEVPTLAGIDVLRANNFAQLKGKRVGLVTNHTGRARDGTATIDLLAAAPGVKLVALFSPEHGIRGELDAKVGDTTDTKTGLPVHSLYGVRTKPTPAQLEGLDVLVYDIQDIGCRFYTYVTTLGLCLEAAGARKLPVMVLDRPNPLGGTVAGPVRDLSPESFVAYHPVPLRHGLTVGELARMFVAERKLQTPLEVVACQNYTHSTTWPATGLPWVNPSPNMRHLTAAHLYPGVGLLETTNLSVGRGTERPFEWVGAPWVDGVALARALNAESPPGIAFVPVSRTPTSSVHAKTPCGGVDLVVTNLERLNGIAVGLTLAKTLKKLYPDDWQTKNLNRLLVHESTLAALHAGKPVAEIATAWQTDLEAYRQRRRAVLIYPE